MTASLFSLVSRSNISFGVIAAPSSRVAGVRSGSQAGCPIISCFGENNKYFVTFKTFLFTM